jgi:hypothetical protein
MRLIATLALTALGLAAPLAQEAAFPTDADVRKILTERASASSWR